jgi:SAM-dependent methyltransferase
VTNYHQTRFTYDPRRQVLWKTLCESWFQRFVPAGGCVLELGAGYGEFINNIRAARRIAIEPWAEATKYIDAGVEVHSVTAAGLDVIEDACVDFAFASNLFEHLTRDELAAVLGQLRRVLKRGGTLNILQPNWRFAYRRYFDDYTHVSVWSDQSLSDFLEAHGYRVLECIPRFMPLTVKSRLPISPLLIRLYLRLPLRPLGQQMLIRAAVES